MIEIKLLHNNSILGVTMHLPKTKIVFLYHTNAIVVSDPFLLESNVFDKINVIYTSKCDFVMDMVDGVVENYRLIQNADIWVGMKVSEAMDILQK